MGSQALTFGLQALTTLFQGAEERAQEATSENEALGEVLTATYSGMQQIAQAYSGGSISQSQALADVAQLRNAFWQTITPKIQPNRNGCASGGSCPSQNGTIPAGYCSGNIGAACCLGCWTIEQMFYDAENVINSGSGTVTVVALAAESKYNFPAFPQQNFVFSEPATPTNVVEGVANSVSTLLGIPTGNSVGQSSSSSAIYVYLLIGIVAVVFLVLLVRR